MKTDKKPSSLSNRKKSTSEENNKPLASESDPNEGKQEPAGFRVNNSEPGSSSEPGKRSGAGASFSVKISEDGTIENLDSMRPRTIENFRNALKKTPGAMEKILGAIDSTAIQVIEPRQVEPFYSGIGMVNMFLAIKLAHIHPVIAQAYVPYTDDERTMLSEATADAVNENLDKCPLWLLKLLQGGGSVSLAKLAMLLFQVHAQKLALIKNSTVETVPAAKPEPAVN